MKNLLIIGLVLVPLLTNGQRIQKVDAVGITVSNMDQALQFYTSVLPFRKVSDVELSGQPVENLKGLFGIRLRKVRLQLGDEFLELTDYLTPGGRAIAEDSRSNDLWFQHIAIVVSDMDAAYAQLRKANVNYVSSEPQTLPRTIPAAEGIKAFYFRDPDDHNLEIIFFPPGKGDKKWQKKTSEIFLGIDHTAIGVASTSESKKFYNDLLGFDAVGESFNYGIEQEHLNNVQGAILHITGNRVSNGPGIEFLEYLSPKTGRHFPDNARVDDLIHWEVILFVDDVTAFFQRAKASDFSVISKQVIELKSPTGILLGFYMRDPDGHVLGLFEKRQ
jgi:catechol 2,3-dioxygenase-like lactoylglutathione lyase family enzyme